MPEFALFVAILAVKLLTETLGRWSENYYHTGQAVKSAALVALTCAVAIPVSRVVLTERNNYAATATVLAVFVVTFAGCRDLERRKNQS